MQGLSREMEEMKNTYTPCSQLSKRFAFESMILFSVSWRFETGLVSGNHSNFKGISRKRIPRSSIVKERTLSYFIRAQRGMLGCFRLLADWSVSEYVRRLKVLRTFMNTSEIPRYEIRTAKKLVFISRVFLKTHVECVKIDLGRFYICVSFQRS